MFQSSAKGTRNDFAIDDEVRLRAAIFYAKLGAYAEVHINSFDDLRQVILHWPHVRVCVPWHRVHSVLSPVFLNTPPHLRTLRYSPLLLEKPNFGVY